MVKRLIAAVAGFIGGGVLSMLFLGLLVSVFDIAVHSVMPAALVIAFICSVIGFCFPGLGARIFLLVDW
jgi:hypothetical protein